MGGRTTRKYWHTKISMTGYLPMTPAAKHRRPGEMSCNGHIIQLVMIVAEVIRGDSNSPAVE